MKKKNCLKCGDLKELSEFSKDSSKKSRWSRNCKLCLNGKLNKGRTAEYITWAKTIMSVPVNVRKTQAFYMVGPVKETQKEIRLR